MSPRKRQSRYKVAPGFNSRLVARRLALRLVQRDVERKAGLAPTSLSRYEKLDDAPVPGDAVIARLAGALASTDMSEEQVLSYLISPTRGALHIHESPQGRVAEYRNKAGAVGFPST